jgi:hypothetical protein
VPSTRTLFAEGNPYATLLGPSETELRAFSFPDTQSQVLLNNDRRRRPQEPDTHTTPLRLSVPLPARYSSLRQPTTLAQAAKALQSEPVRFGTPAMLLSFPCAPLTSFCLQFRA